MDISIILLTHNEGLLVHRTVVAIEKMRAIANHHQITTEVLVMMDNVSFETKDYFLNQTHLGYRYFEVSFGECGSPRNEGLKHAKGKYVALVDGDDIFSSNYLVDSFTLAENNNSPAIYHAEYAITFGEESTIWKLFDQDSLNLNPKSFIEYNPYHSMCFADKQVFVDYPYNVTKFINGFGYEDWDWNLRTIVGGYNHYIVPETIAFIRRKKSGSLVKMQMTTSATTLPNDFFFKDIFLKITNRYDSDVEKVYSNFKVKNFPSLSVVLRKVYNFLKPKKRSQSAYYFNYTIDSILVKIKEILMLFVKNKGVKNAEFLANTTHVFLTSGGLSKQVTELIDETHQVEPLIPISRVLIRNSYKYVTPIYTESGDFYKCFCQKVTFSSFHLLFLNQENVDLFSLEYIKKYITSSESNVVVISESGGEDLVKKIGVHVKLFSLDDYFSATPLDVKLKAISKIIQHFNILGVHIINSKIAYDLYSKYGKSIKMHAPLFVCIGSDQIDELSRFDFEDFFEIHHYVAKSITQKKEVIDMLCGIYGYNRNLFQCIK